MNISEIKVSYKPQKVSVVSYNNSSMLYEMVRANWNADTIELQEEVKVILLNRNNQLLGVYELAKGGVSGAFVDVKLLLSVALKCVASNIVLVHNHPSGNLKPSKADIALTEKVKKASKQVDMVLLDHLIVTKDDYYSFADNCQL
ncbi:DNA repair protein [Kriegella sp. EG-1]|nr:DNA repair protein [Flavobacteriaceae bacterium EG-1]